MISDWLTQVRWIGALFLTCACSAPGGPQVGTQTNWLRVCEADAECGEGNICVCSACTRKVESDPTVCDDLVGSTALSKEHEGAIALCSGEEPPVQQLCLMPCESGECPEGSQCVADVCSPVRKPTLVVSIDTERRYQELIGFGATVAYIEAEIVNHPAKEELYDAMFVDSGFGVLRLGSIYRATEEPNFAAVQDITEAAETRMAQPPVLFLTSGSPPAELKQNNSTYCEGNPDTCTLTRTADGEFDYEGFANHFRRTIEAYAAAGISIDFLSIQNDPNYVPPAGKGIETCHFLPVEGTETVTIDGVEVEVEYPGYMEALNAVLSASADLPARPQFAGPETTGLRSSADYIQELDESKFDAFAHHLYGMDPFNPDLEALADLAQFGADSERPLFQTEMADGGIETALLAQEALVDLGAAMYLQTGFVAPANLTTPDENALIALTDTGFNIQDPYQALRHFAYHTGAGWTRVDADLDIESVRVSAWISPDDQQLTVILVNPLDSEEVVELDLDEPLVSTTTTRTVFDGVERYADLGQFSSDDTFVLPKRAVMTLNFAR